MKVLRLLTAILTLTISPLTAEDFFDRVGEALTVSTPDGEIRARLNGLLDLELYRFDLPPPGLIDANHRFLANPRLSLFLDAQLGPHVYFFAQSRVDRDFDPHDQELRLRLDEYALRINPALSDGFEFQIGRFATVVGNFMPRHLSWDNPFVSAPLPYENLTLVSDYYAPANVRSFLASFVPHEDENLPLIWGPSYASGASVAGKIGDFNYALEIKNSSLASRPSSWDVTQIGFEHPTVSGRLGYRPNESWNIGFSASDGPYLRPEAEPTLPPGQGLGDFSQLVLAQDISYALHHLQLWAEVYAVRFEVPRVGDVDTVAYYLEGKYKFTPQLFGALRWNQQLFNAIPDGAGGTIRWGHDLWRMDTSVGYRFTAHTQLKLQYSFQSTNSDSRGLGHTVATQFTLRF